MLFRANSLVWRNVSETASKQANVTNVLAFLLYTWCDADWRTREYFPYW